MRCPVTGVAFLLPGVLALAGCGTEPSGECNPAASALGFEPALGATPDAPFLNPDSNCCKVAGTLLDNDRVGCDDPEVEACVCAILPACCETVWGPTCVAMVMAACSAFSSVDPVALGWLEFDSDNDGLDDLAELTGAAILRTRRMVRTSTAMAF